MARPRTSEHDRREQAFHQALIDHDGDVEAARDQSGIADSHVVKILNRGDYLALVYVLRTGESTLAAAPARIAA